MMFHFEAANFAARTARFMKVAALLTAVLAAGGCASNLTNFDFPVFGLMQKDSGSAATAPEHTSRLGEP